MGKAVQQITMLDNAMEQIQVRCKRSEKTGNELYQQQLRLRLDILEGMKTLMEEYACYLSEVLGKIEALVQLL